MSHDWILNPPLLTSDLPGVGGRIKVEPEDFEVEEIPAYLPSGQGDFLFLWIEKRDMGAEFFQRQVARRLNLPNGEVGIAGLKDRRAVTRQWVSVPAQAEPRLGDLEGDGLRVLTVGRHGNKLRTGHLHGNRFNVLIRDVDSSNIDAVAGIVERLRALGVPNFYGSQRFGRDGETLAMGLALLRGEKAGGRNPFLRKLALSAAQSAFFNVYLAQRFHDGWLHTVLAGDVMAKVPQGGMFVAEDVAAEQARFDRREIVPAGPIFGKKTFRSQGAALERESAILPSFDIPPHAFEGWGKLVLGTRRHNLVFVSDLEATVEENGLRVRVTLPAGSYATVLLREFTKAPIADGELSIE